MLELYLSLVFDTEYILNNFDFEAFESRLKELSSRQPTGTLEDMEYPYAFYKIGSYYKAYQEFDKILPMAWKRQKYILYFLCLYNMYSLRFAIKSEFLWSCKKTIDWEPIYKKLSEIDLYDTLSKLPIPQEIKKIFYDLLANRYIGNKAVESEELKEKVHQDRKLSENGGFSINSNIVALIAKYQREKLFSQSNFVLSDFNKYDKAICRNTVSAIDLNTVIEIKCTRFLNTADICGLAIKNIRIFGSRIRGGNVLIRNRRDSYFRQNLTRSRSNSL